jgi:hypothetical protein
MEMAAWISRLLWIKNEKKNSPLFRRMSNIINSEIFMSCRDRFETCLSGGSNVTMYALMLKYPNPHLLYRRKILRLYGGSKITMDEIRMVIPRRDMPMACLYKKSLT